MIKKKEKPMDIRKQPDNKDNTNAKNRSPLLIISNLTILIA